MVNTIPMSSNERLHLTTDADGVVASECKLGLVIDFNGLLGDTNNTDVSSHPFTLSAEARCGTSRATTRVERVPRSTAYLAEDLVRPAGVVPKALDTIADVKVSAAHVSLTDY